MRNKYAKVCDPNDFVTDPGDKYHVTYAPKVMPDGMIDLIPDGKEDINAKIESFRSTTDMQWILQKLAMGDTSVLNQSQAMYGDFTSMPKTYAESLQLVIDAEKHFYEMPLDIRNKFDNNYQKWFVSAGSKEWLDKMGISFEKSVEASEKDVEASEKDVESGVAE